MNVRRTNLLLWMAATLLCAAALLTLAGAWLLPAQLEDGGAPRRAAAATTRLGPAALPPLSSFEPIWKLDLRKSLTDAPSAAAGAVAPVAMAPRAASGPSVGFTLVGTIGDSLALIRTAAGIDEVKAVGDAAGSGRITAIRPSQVDLQVGAQTMTLTKPKEQSPGG